MHRYAHHDATMHGMRTTLTLDADVAAALEALQRAEGIGVSEAANRLIRAGLVSSAPDRADYVHRTADVGIKVDVSNIGDVLDLLDEH